MADIKIVNRSDIGRCPTLIMLPQHYRADGSCRHDDPDHKEMREWGYRWDKKKAKWVP